MTDKKTITEDYLRAIFDENFEHLRLESGHSLSIDVKEAAWDQVRMYWRKLREIAEAVTDTEVRLILPNQKTAKGRTFSIEGIVDIVREAAKVTMYDIKTHELEYIQANRDLYGYQLNLYAYIWQHLRGERLDETAVISTSLPSSVIGALRLKDTMQIEAACRAWDPVVPIAFDANNVEKTVNAFAEVVDKIEDREYRPPDISKLMEREDNGTTFASRVCRNCDARFSCSAFSNYARQFRDRSWRKFADFYDIENDEGETIDRFAIFLSVESDDTKPEDYV